MEVTGLLCLQRDFAEKMKKEKNRKDANSRKYEERLKEMQSTIERNESTIHMLKLQLQHGREEVGYNLITYV